MIEMYKAYKVRGERRGSVNEFVVCKHIYEDGRVWLANVNMPFLGTISKVMTLKEAKKFLEL